MGILSRHDMDGRTAAGDGADGILQVPRFRKQAIRMGAAMRVSGRIRVVRAELCQCIHLSQDAGVLLPDVRRRSGRAVCRSGLLPANSHYRYFFSESTVAAQIVDEQGTPVYRAKNAPDLTPGQLDAAARGPILLNADTRLQSAPVQDGRVYWVEDISKINRIREQLAEINAQLAEENELIQAENALETAARADRRKEPAHGRNDCPRAASAASNQSTFGGRKRSES